MSKNLYYTALWPLKTLTNYCTDELQKNNLCTYDHVVSGKYASVAFSLTGGNLFKWFKDEFATKEIDLAELTGSDDNELLLEHLPDKPTEILVLPYFTPSGTPYFDVSLKGAILGLDLSVSRFEILKALLEGIAFEMKLNLEILQKSGCEVSELRIIGGGARSMKLIQLKSDVIGMPITVMDVSEAGCMGVAILAYAAYSNKDVKKIAKEWIRPVAKVYPKHQDHYIRKFENYKKLYPALKALQ